MVIIRQPQLEVDPGRGPTAQTRRRGQSPWKSCLASNHIVGLFSMLTTDNWPNRFAIRKVPVKSPTFTKHFCRCDVNYLETTKCRRQNPHEVRL